MFVVLWEYEARAGCEAAFAALYGNEGEWVALFREYPGFLGTELLREARDVDATPRFVTIDRWTSQDAYDAFLTAAQSRYAHIDGRGDALTLTERRLGTYTTP